MSDFKKLTSKSSLKKIDSPMAKYNSAGQLTCIVCNQVIKSEVLWTGHLSSKTHTENKNKMKMKLIGEMAKPISAPPKDISNVNKTIESKRSISSISDESVSNSKKQKIEKLIKTTNSIDLNAVNAKYNAEENKSIPTTASVQSEEDRIEKEKKEEIVLAMTGTSLPEGFFDDPDLDAKARGQSRSDNLEAEFEEFKKIIQSEEVKSEVIIEKDDMMSNVDRDIEEVDELIDRWTKIENLHVRRENLVRLKKKEEVEKIEVDSDSDADEEVDLDNILNFNLRSKIRF